ncbi:MAG: deoxyribodipyrimidine photo-lyase [bacterium]
MTSVLWFRRDLRLHDHPALQAALERGPVAPLFVLDEALINGRWRSPNRVAFMLACLRELDVDLRARGNQLHVRIGNPRVAVPAFAAAAGAIDVFVSRDYSPYARRRDGDVKRALEQNSVAFHAHRGTLIHEPEEIATGAGEPYSVFSPFFRTWAKLATPRVTPAPDQIPGVSRIEAGELPDLATLGILRGSAEVIEPGEAAALRRLEIWANSGLPGYASDRDVLANERTSRLSQDLRWGSLSPSQIVSALPTSGVDREKFISELAWREFYFHVLWHHPTVLREPFLSQFATIRWDNDSVRFEAWKTGRTGFPVVDAAMRQLLATGYMHNRGRMIVASFLTKDLHIDWRLGEAHFMEHLVDGDPASNNGGWQWAASTGTDPQPYFRIFNPLLQSKRFDPEGVYIRRWVAELKDVPTAWIHEPATMAPLEQAAAGCVIGKDYPAPIVNHAIERDRAIADYAAAREATRSG